MKLTTAVRVFLTPTIAALALLLVPNNSFAEPYLAVYKGMQCNACHSNAAGGGKRNTYGNVFSQSELPAERAGSSSDGYWTGDVMKWLSVGANLRGGARYTDVPGEQTRSEFQVNRGTVYLEAKLIENRLSLYVDQQFAPGSSLNREAYALISGKGGKLQFLAGQFFLPYGLRLQDDTAFVRQATGINFTNPDRGVQVAYTSGSWSSQMSVTNGSGGATETDNGKQVSAVTNYVRPGWRAGASININDNDSGDRQMQNLYFGLKTGQIAWLAEIDWISDDLSVGGDRDSIAGLIEGNWLYRKGHNLKVSYEYLDPDGDISEDHQVRYSVLWEYTPMQFLQGRIGARIYDGIPQRNFQNRDEFFAELHAFF